MVSWFGISCRSSRNVRSQLSLARPKALLAQNVPAPQITPHRDSARRFVSEWWRVPFHARGRSTGEVFQERSRQSRQFPFLSVSCTHATHGPRDGHDIGLTPNLQHNRRVLACRSIAKTSGADNVCTQPPITSRAHRVEDGRPGSWLVGSTQPSSNISDTLLNALKVQGSAGICSASWRRPSASFRPAGLTWPVVDRTFNSYWSHQPRARRRRIPGNRKSQN
jgi:hypothetical protein